MSREKAARLAALSEKDMAIYKSKRNQRSYWQRLSHEDWVAFCNAMGEWFLRQAPDEWDNYIIANNKRKAESDKRALENKK
jgi:hypothetical protein